MSDEYVNVGELVKGLVARTKRETFRSEVNEDAFLEDAELVVIDCSTRNCALYTLSGRFNYTPTSKVKAKVDEIEKHLLNGTPVRVKCRRLKYSNTIVVISDVSPIDLSTFTVPRKNLVSGRPVIRNSKIVIIGSTDTYCISEGTIGAAVLEHINEIKWKDDIVVVVSERVRAPHKKVACTEKIEGVFLAFPRIPIEGFSQNLETKEEVEMPSGLVEELTLNVIDARVRSTDKGIAVDLYTVGECFTTKPTARVKDAIEILRSGKVASVKVKVPVGTRTILDIITVEEGTIVPDKHRIIRGVATLVAPDVIMIHSGDEVYYVRSDSVKYYLLKDLVEKYVNLYVEIVPGVVYWRQFRGHVVYGLHILKTGE